MELMLTDAEHRLTTERQLKYQGTAKVNLDQISLQPLSSREIDHKNVERLHEIFAKDGCNRLDLRNHVTAVVSKQHLQRTCHATGLTLEELKSRQQQCPRLGFRGREVKCLHGQHRLKAAEDFLSPSDRWWTVDLYLDDISPDLRNALVDEYANEKPPTDGEVYRKIRQYQHESNALFQSRWWSRLSPNKAKRLRRLTSPDNTYLCAAFDALLAIPGLWNGMSLGSLNTVMALKCDEEVIHYLKHVKNFWATLVNHDRAQMARIDLHTVDTLQLYAPRASTVDRKIVKGKILGGEVFSNFSRSERVAIWESLRSHETCDGIIPSLHTFFRDVLYLEVCANAVKRLVTLNKQHPTIRRALVHSFRPGPADTDCLIQTSESTFRRQPGSNDERLSLAYRQIWMYAMRHYPDMAKNIRDGQAANPARAKARAKADESVIHDMATLARKLGFRTTQINAILQQSPDQQIARAALLKARKPDHYHYNSETFESLIEQIAGCFARAIPNENPPMTLTAGRAMKLRDRYGIPPEYAQPLDRPHIFLDRLHLATTMQRNLSSLEVRRSVYYAFFGKPSSQTFMPYTPPAWPSASEPSSPLFVPRDNTHANEPFAEDMSISSLSDGSSNSRRRLSETREDQPEERRQGQRPLRPPTEMHSSSQARVSSPESSAGSVSPLSEGVTTDNLDSSIAEDQSDISERQGGQAGEDACTEIDENELLERTEGEDSRARDITNVDTSIPGTPIERDMSEILEERVVADDRQPSGPVQTSSPLRSSHTARTQSAIRRNRNRDAIWQPYNTSQRGNRRAARTVSPGEERTTDGNSTGLGPIAEYRARPEPLQTIGEHTELEQPAESPDIVTQVWPYLVVGQAGTSPGTSRGAPQYEAAGNDEQYLARAEQSEHRNREGEEPIFSPMPPTDPGEGITGQLVALDKESIADQVEELIQEERLSLERADTPSQLEASRVVQAHTVARRVTEIPADLPSLILRLREESAERDGCVPTVDDPPAAHPEGGAAVHPLRTEPIVQDTEERRHGDHLGPVNLSRSPARRTRTSPQPHNPERAVRKLRKNQATRRELNRAGTRDAAIADELWGSDEEGYGAGGIMAGTPGFPQQDVERYPAFLPDPEQAQREAIARQEGEDLLFDTPHMMQETDTEMEDLEEDRTPAVAVRPNRKVTKPSKVAKPKQAQPGGSSKASRAGLSSQRRAVDVEARVQGEVTQLDVTQPDITKSVSTGVSGVVHDEANDPTPLAVDSINRGPAGGSSPEGRVTITFRAYQRGEWIVTDAVTVESANPAEAQATAEHYARDPEQEAHFYDCSLRKVAVDQCVRAAIDDGSFTVLMGLGRGLAVTRNLVASVTQVLENVGTAGAVIEEEEL
ncbi:hypothetical protein N7492_008279 [Penicillium capsulatum]|uniref:Uncharacterized protein n=1 Tax=Penicillium capsulatum TaxID=69766 RepID=A0A9W9HQF9_9EURO|nr:hypothetical protein N7492_008279 [Penicillium capsulatum]KAJ6105689.1 hypothetical protein N7512_009206 [Penicillium capsulatum]